MPDQPGPPAALPEHFKDEWARARGILETLDERVHATRTTVFGLFSGLLTASSVFGKSLVPSGVAWLGLHLSLLGLLIAGRFIEQQAHRLQDIVAGRACVLEMLTPVELTDTISERWGAGGSRRTTYVYAALGLVSAVVASVAAAAGAVQVLVTAAITAAYLVLVVLLGRQDVTYAREGQDWSFDRTTCNVHESISVLLVNLGDDPAYPTTPAAEIVRVFDDEGRAVPGPSRALEVPDALLGPGRSLPPRRACRWLWRPQESGVWFLRVAGAAVARRSIRVLPASAPRDGRCC